MLISKILSTAYSKSEVLKHLRLLQDFAVKKIYSSSKEQNNFLASLAEEDISWLQAFFAAKELNFTQEKLLNFLGIKVKGKDFSSLDQTFHQTEEKIRQIESLTLYLARVFSEDDLAKIGQKLRKDWGQDFLMEIKYDPSLVAGTKLVWKGQMKDYSLKTLINQKKDQFLKIIKETR